MIGERVIIMKVQSVNDPTPDRLRAWIDKQQNYRLMILRNVENKQLFQKQLAFGEGESVCWLLE